MNKLPGFFQSPIIKKLTQKSSSSKSKWYLNINYSKEFQFPSSSEIFKKGCLKPDTPFRPLYLLHSARAKKDPQP